MLVVDFEPPLDALVAEMAGAGIEAVATIPAWQGQVGVYAAVFVRRN